MPLFSARELGKCNIEASDGKIGSVDDLFFDDEYWTIRYVVVDTGSWLRPGRRVLVSPHSIEDLNVEERLLKLRLSKQSIENGPEVDADKPVSRRMEEKLARYYNWPLYWLPGSLGLVMMPETAAGDEQAAKARREADTGTPAGDPNLRSVNEVSGYRIDAKDGDVGKVHDLVISDDHWLIPYVVVDTGTWLPGRKVLISPRWAENIDWTERAFEVGLTKRRIETSPEFDTIRTMERSYEEKLHGHYGFQKYWEKV